MKSKTSSKHDHRRIPEHSCPHCGYKSDCVSPPVGDECPMPEEDDLTMCLNCGKFSAFTKELQLRHLNEKEKQWIRDRPGLFQMQLARAHVVGTRDLREQQESGSESGSPQ